MDTYEFPMTKLYVYRKHKVWKAPQIICVHVHMTYITYRESAMEKVAQQILNAHREWKPATVWHSLLSAGESGHDEHGWP